MHGFVLDVDGVSDIDFTGARMLIQLVGELRHDGVTMAVARSSHLVHHDLKHSGVLGAIGADHVCASVEEAVEALSARQ